VIGGTQAAVYVTESELRAEQGFRLRTQKEAKSLSTKNTKKHEKSHQFSVNDGNDGGSIAYGEAMGKSELVTRNSELA